MKRHILTFIALALALIRVQADDISVPDVTIVPGTAAQVGISLDNTETNLVSFQMDLTLPEGISINKNDCSLSNRFTDEDQELTIGKQGDNVYRLTSTSYAMTPLSGTSGEIITLSLSASESATGGTATLSNIRFVTSNSERVTLDDVSFSISVSSGVEDDGAILIMGQPWEARYQFVENWENATDPMDGDTPWYSPDFNDSAWLTLTGPLDGNNWNAEYSAYYLRRTFTLNEVKEGYYSFTVNHDDYVKVYLNGVLACEKDCGNHEFFIPSSMLVEGENLLAIYIDDRGGGNRGLNYELHEMEEEVDSDIFIDEQGVVYEREGDVYFVRFYNFNASSVVIPDELFGLPVARIGNYAFDRSIALTSISIPSSVTSIGNFAFWHCYSLTSITIPSTVRSVGHWAFEYCSSLSSVVLEEGVEELCNGAFARCGALASITIPASVTTIGSWVFGFGTNPTYVKVLNPDPVSCFIDFTNPANAILFVPAGCKEAYQAFGGWSGFKLIVEMSLDELDELLTSARQLYDESEEGTEIGQYPASARATLLSVIQDVENGMSSEMTQEEIGEAMISLYESIENFRNQIIQDTSTWSVSSAQQLIDFAEHVNIGNPHINACLTADIDLDGYAYTPIGTEENPFCGTFDGQGHVISNLRIETDNNNQGLVGAASGGAVVRNVTLDNTCVISGGSYVAGIVGIAYNTGTLTIENCGNEASVVAAGVNAAGILGCAWAQATTVVITNCYNAGTISADGESAGISGWLGSNATVTNCYNIGEVSGLESYEKYFVRHGNNVKILNCYETIGNQVTWITSDQVESGELCWLLNGESSENPNWFQTLGEDAHPVLSASHKVVHNNGDVYYNDEFISDDILLSGGILPWEMKYVFRESCEDLQEPEADSNENPWYAAEYDDSAWETLTGPMARDAESFSPVNYSWETEGSCYFLRRKFQMDAVREGFYEIHGICDDNMDVYLNGHKIFKTGLGGFNWSFRVPSLFLHEGENTLAIFAADGGGDAYLDYSMHFLQEDEIIEFADPDVEEICCNSYWFDSNGDGHLSKVEAASVESLMDSFMAHEESVLETFDSFDELQYFTGLTELNAWVFLNCRNLSSIIIPESVKSISSWAFQNCSSLTSITIPESVTSIESDAFLGCSGLTSVTFLGNALGDRQHFVNIFSGCPDDILFNIPEGTAGSYLRRGFKNLSDKSGLPLVCEVFEAEATRISAMAEEVSDGDKTALASAIEEARDVVANTDDYMAVYAQIAAVKSAAKTFLTTATLPQDFDVTAATITNPDFDLLDIGWKVDNIAENIGRLDEEGINHWENGDVVMDNFIEAYQDCYTGRALGDGNISQTITNLPAGTYRFEADIIASNEYDASAEVTGVCLFAGENMSSSVSTEFRKPQHISFTFENPTTCDVTVGINITGTNANWVAADNFRLYYVVQEEVEVTDISQLDNVIYIEPFVENKGNRDDISIKMKNSAEIRGFQFELVLPEGITPVEEDDVILCGLNPDRSPKNSLGTLYHTIEAKRQDDGSYRILCGSQQEKSFSVGDGEIAKLYVNVSPDMATGDYPIILRNIKLSETDISHFYQVEEVVTKLTIVDIIGDINGDKTVDVSDYIGVANHILGNTPSGFNYNAADVNRDGAIDVSDYIGIANIILTGSIYGNRNATTRSLNNNEEVRNPQ